MTFPATAPPLAGIVHTDVRVAGHRWHVATAGDQGAPAIVLLHGWPQHWWIWHRIIADLARTHRVLAPDLRGFGWSDAPDSDYSKAGLAADVVRLLDELGVDRCTLVGHDWGAFTAFLTALQAPERVDRLAAFSILHPWPQPRKPDLRSLGAVSYQVPLAAPGLGPGLLRAAGPPLVRQLLKRGAGRNHRWNPEDLRLYTEQWRRPASARATSALYRTFLTKELKPLMAGQYRDRQLEMPILLATGRCDPVVTPDSFAGAAEHAPNLRTTVIENAGHFVLDEQPQRVLELIREELGA